MGGCCSGREVPDRDVLDATQKDYKVLEIEQY